VISGEMRARRIAIALETPPVQNAETL